MVELKKWELPIKDGHACMLFCCYFSGQAAPQNTVAQPLCTLLSLKGLKEFLHLVKEVGFAQTNRLICSCFWFETGGGGGRAVQQMHKVAFFGFSSPESKICL